jgi:hypothetical protein
MSEQSSLLPDEEPKRAHRPGRKRKGEYEVWMRHTSRRWAIRWHKMRSYAKEEVARKAMAEAERKHNDWYRHLKIAATWEFKLRMPGDPKPSDDQTSR